MHISEGVLSGPVLIGSGALAAAGTAIGLKKMDFDHIARTGILSASFFVASFIHIPIGPSSVHLIMNGIVGLILGWTAFPAILVALLLQAVLFQYGGITTLGANTLIMAVPAVISYYIFSPLMIKKTFTRNLAAFGCGFLSVFLGALLMGLSLYFTEKNFLETAAVVMGFQFPVMVLEGLITVLCVGFLMKVQPEIFPDIQPVNQK